jgi:hypothetical protein
MFSEHDVNRFTCGFVRGIKAECPEIEKCVMCGGPFRLVESSSPVPVGLSEIKQPAPPALGGDFFAKGWFIIAKQVAMHLIAKGDIAIQ